MSKQYIGKQKVSKVEEIEGKIRYTLADGNGSTVTQEQFDSMVKDHEYDDAMVRVQKWLPAIRELMAVLLRNDMTIIEKDFVIGRLDETIVQNYGSASAKLFGAKSGFEGDISLSQIDNVLKS